MTTLIIRTDAPSTYGPPQGRWTYADWESLPDDGNRYEIIEGVLYMSTAPSSFHQWSVLRLYRLLGIPAEDQGIAYVYLAPIGVLMPGCDPVQPDFVLVRKENAGIIRDRRIRGVPDLIAEVLSPGSATYDEDIKLAAYAKAGVPEYAILDPALRVVRYYALERPGQYAAPQVFAEGQQAEFHCAPGIRVPVTDLFAGSPDTTL